jgi:hypothetical protein
VVRWGSLTRTFLLHSVQTHENAFCSFHYFTWACGDVDGAGDDVAVIAGGAPLGPGRKPLNQPRGKVISAVSTATAILSQLFSLNEGASMRCFEITVD